MGLFDSFRRNKKDEVSPQTNSEVPPTEEPNIRPVPDEQHEIQQENSPEIQSGGQLDPHPEDHAAAQLERQPEGQPESQMKGQSENQPENQQEGDMPSNALTQETVVSFGEPQEESGPEDEEELPDSLPPIKNTPIKSMDEKAPVNHAIGETKIIAIINQKGGVGKSTTAINLCAALGELDKAVLVVDLDPQGNTTSGLGVDKGQVVHDVYDVLLGELPVKEAIIPDVCKGLDLLPATINLAGAEVELVNEMARENRLKTAIGGLRGAYDYIFIDCPPALGLLTVNALVASDKLLIPIQCEFYALEGVTKLLDSMKRVKTVLNPGLDTFGVLLTMYDGRTVLARQVAAEVRNFFGDTVFKSVIPRTVKLSEAPSFGQPITEYDPKGRGAEAYLSLAKEVIKRG